jgi:hypothetical protein
LYGFIRQTPIVRPKSPAGIADAGKVACGHYPINGVK